MIAVAINTGMGSLYIQTEVSITDIANLADKPVTNVNNYVTALFLDLRSLDKNTNLFIGGTQNLLDKATHYLALSVNGSFNVSVSATYYDVAYGRTSNTKFSGSLKNFKESLNPISKFTNLKEKLLRFKYTGGTTKGVRIIRLEEAQQKGTDILLKGVDMAHALDPKATDKGYRSYLLSKIDGQIDVLN